MTDGHEDIAQIARDGAFAVANGDGGRSVYLMDLVAELMREMTVTECEWLSIAVSNGAFNRLLHEPPKPGAAVNTTQTADGEIWDI